MSDPAFSSTADRGGAHDSGGERSVLLLLHGVGGTWHIWKPVLARLEAQHRVIAPTLPGHEGGPAMAASGDATVAGLADQLIGMMSARGITRAHVAGNSLGGWLALELARRGFARSVVALSPAGGWCTPADYQKVARRFRIFYALMPLIRFLTGWLLRFASVRRALAKETMEHGERVPAADFRDMLRAMANTRILPGLLRSMGRQGPIAAMAAGDVPIRIAWCERDCVIPFATYGQPVLDRVQGAQGARIERAGHVPMYDEPEQVAAQILEVTAGAERAGA